MEMIAASRTPGKPPDGGKQAVEHRGACLVVRIFYRGQVQSRGQHIAGMKSLIDRQNAHQAAYQQSRAHQQRGAECDLGAHQQLRDAQPMPALGRTPSAVRSASCGSDREARQAGIRPNRIPASADSAKSEQHRAPVELHFIQPRHIHRRPGHQTAQRGVGEHQSEHTTGDRNRQAFC